MKKIIKGRLSSITDCTTERTNTADAWRDMFKDFATRAQSQKEKDK